MKAENIKIRPQSEFPYIEQYRERFPINADTVFVYIDTIYTNIDELPYDVFFHELKHLEQQEEYGPLNWLNFYWKSPKFRLDQELEAYRYQLDKVKELTNDRQEHFNILTECARNLSSELYGKLCTYQQAVDKLSIRKG